MATSDEQYGEEAPYHPGMTTLAAADLLLLGLGDSGGAGAGACLDEVALAAMVDGRMEGEARAASIRHVAGCASCRRQLAALIALSQEPAVAAEVARVQGGGLRLRRPLLSALGVAAAAAVLFLVVWPRRPATEADVERDPTITAATAPVALEPVGAVRDARALIWGRVDGASSYRATLFDSTGTVLFEARLADTAVTIPDSVTLVPRRAYFWKVEARTGWDRWTASDLFEFRVDATAGPQAERSTPTPGFLATSSSATRPPDSTQPALLSDGELVRGVRAGSVEVHSEFREALAGAVRGDSASRAVQLRIAARLATAYQAAWRDDFLS
ncbi:MAG TPA: hypothetical protein VFO95_10150, partial [Gemmatimonadales bacterium]|nr:hypothetical protein [Gemmatimonadales bacterium]